MALSTATIAIMGLGSFLAFVYIILLVFSSKYNHLIKPLDEKEFRFNYLYGVGFIILDLIKYKYSSKGELKRRQKLAVLYDSKYADYYLRVIAAQRITIAFTVLLLGIAVYGMTEDIAVLLIFIMFTYVAFYYFGDIPNRKINARSEEILNDFPDVVSKLALLTNAGMILREAWEHVAYTGESTLYKEMRLVVDNINNGMAEIDAYDNFGSRCMIPEIKKFTSTLIQGTTKGSRDLAMMLTEQSHELWEAKQHHVRQMGEKASSKLLIPICIVFLGILIMIIVPIFSNLGV